ncbi:Cadherin-related family member 4 [Gossypium australe]|uniref:Cadherin-related family member 4 n=1 Tax=Gossypium australe TaxID=47621 RepID=A0A5B6VU75_9ROSI|nr:Cadherin-related family member 4 [Gossypium australe]
MQATGTGTAQLPRVVQQLPRGRGQAKGENDMGRGKRASDRGAGPTEVRQPALLRILQARDVLLEVQGTVFLADLMELPFREFYLILGMDWLVKHWVSLDCATNRVILRTEEDNDVVVI